ncbi:MAG: glycosyltransferase family 2 protein [Sediminibacterium sp.]
MINKTLVILVNWNSYALTRECLLSLQQVRTDELDIILVDNQSADGSGKQLEKEFPHLIYLQAPDNLGFTGGNNLALLYAIEKGYQNTMLLNNDTTVAPDFLTHLKKYLDAHPTVGAVQPLIYCSESPEQIWNAGSYFLHFLGQPIIKNKMSANRKKNNQALEVEWITGCAFMVRMEILKKTGLLSDKMFMYFEDVDLSFRIRQQGYSLAMIPASKIWHVGGMSNRQKQKTAEGYVNPFVHYLNARNRIWLLKKYTPFYFFPTVLFYHLVYFSGLLIYFMSRLRWKKTTAVLKGIREGITDHLTQEFPNHP